MKIRAQPGNTGKEASVVLRSGQRLELGHVTSQQYQAIDEAIRKMVNRQV